VLALQVKISGGIEICQALLNALVVPNNHAQGTIKFVQCTPNACLRCLRFWRTHCFLRIRIHASSPSRRTEALASLLNVTKWMWEAVQDIEAVNSGSRPLLTAGASLHVTRVTPHEELQTISETQVGVTTKRLQVGADAIATMHRILAWYV